MNRFVVMERPVSERPEARRQGEEGEEDARGEERLSGHGRGFRSLLDLFEGSRLGQLFFAAARTIFDTVLFAESTT